MMMDMEGSTRERWGRLGKLSSLPPSLMVCPLYTPGVPFLFLEASDEDEPGTANSDLRFYILNQAPARPSPDMFQLEPRLGALALSPEGESELGVMKRKVMESWGMQHVSRNSKMGWSWRDKERVF